MTLVGLIVLSLALGLTAWLGFVWSVRSGQYDDPEGPKYRMLEEDDEAARPSGNTAAEGTEGQGRASEGEVKDAEARPRAGKHRSDGGGTS